MQKLLLYELFDKLDMSNNWIKLQFLTTHDLQDILAVLHRKVSFVAAFIL